MAAAVSQMFSLSAEEREWSVEDSLIVIDDVVSSYFLIIKILQK